MNAPVTAAATEAQQIEAALCSLLTAIAWADDQPSCGPDRGPVAAGMLVMEMLDRMEGWTAAQQAANDLLRRPAPEALRQAISTLGVRLHEIGGTKLMGNVLERVAALDPRHVGRRTDIMDKRFDGIGSWVA